MKKRCFNSVCWALRRHVLCSGSPVWRWMGSMGAGLWAENMPLAWLDWWWLFCNCASKMLAFRHGRSQEGTNGKPIDWQKCISLCLILFAFDRWQMKIFSVKADRQKFVKSHLGVPAIQRQTNTTNWEYNRLGTPKKPLGTHWNWVDRNWLFKGDKITMKYFQFWRVPVYNSISKSKPMK